MTETCQVSRPIFIVLFVAIFQGLSSYCRFLAGPVEFSDAQPPFRSEFQLLIDGIKFAIVGNPQGLDKPAIRFLFVQVEQQDVPLLWI